MREMGCKGRIGKVSMGGGGGGGGGGLEQVKFIFETEEVIIGAVRLEETRWDDVEG